ncbi:MAG: TolC family protein [Myxococcota bacterium]
MLSLCFLTVLAASETTTRALSLAEAIELGVAKDPKLGLASIEQRSAELAVFRSRLDQITLRSDAQLQELWARTGMGGDQAASLGLGLSSVNASVGLPIFAGFRLQAGMERADALSAASAQDLETARRLSAASVARAYWAVRKLELLVAVQGDALARSARAEEIATARVAAGLAPVLDQNRARQKRLAAEATLVDLRGRTQVASAELLTLLGLEAPVRLSDPVSAGRPEISWTEALRQAHERRPDLRAAALRIDAQREGVRIAESAYYPELDAQATLQVGNNPLIPGVGSRSVSGSANPFADVRADLQLGLSVSINLFDTLHTKNQVDQAKLEVERRQTEARSLDREVEREVKEAVAAVAHLDGLLRGLAPAKALAQDNLEIIQKRYENGEALVFELLDAEIDLLGIERQLTEASAERTLAELLLQAATGAPLGTNL